uniref:Uncharacterized protein n=1 Tax=Lactuca sativa TaxID=4236 RepID=A0A9R1XGV6_LACSA|nr:hypothetical protein LSAT_V11C400228590 [Lactuca sativa]
MKLSDSSIEVRTEVFQADNMGIGSIIGGDSEQVGSKAAIISPNFNFTSIPVISPVLSNSIKMEDGLIDEVSSSVIEFEKDIAQFCCPREKNAMMTFWNCLSASEKEGFVHGLRFTKKKYDSGKDADNSIEDPIDSMKKTASKVEANFGKNQIPFKPSSSLFPSSVDMKKTSDLEASDGLQKIGETVINLMPEGVPNQNLNELVIVDLHNICSMQSLVKEKKEKRKIEIDEMVSKQLEQVCNEIIYHFPSKFSHLEIINKGEFKFKYVDPEDEGTNVQMVIDGKEDNKGNI